MKKIILISLIIITALLLTAVYSYWTNESLDKQNKNSGTVLSKNDLMFNKDSYDYNRASQIKTSDQVFFDDMVRSVSADIASTSDEKAILNKKAVVFYSYPSSSLITDREKRVQKTIAAYNGFFDIYNQAKTNFPNSSDEWLKAKILNALQMTYQTGCYVYQDLSLSSWSEHPFYKVNMSKYANKQLATQSFFYDLLKSEQYTDNLYLGTKMSILARILDNFSGELNAQERDKYTIELRLMLDAFRSAPQTNNFDSNSRKIILPNIYQAYSYYVLSKFDKTITKEMVKNNFKDKMGISYAALKSDMDPAYINMLWFEEIYLKFLYESNGGVINPEIESTIDKIVSYTNKLSQGELYASAISFFTANSQNDMGGWDGIRTNMIEVAKKNKKMADYLKAYGLKI